MGVGGAFIFNKKVLLTLCILVTQIIIFFLVSSFAGEEALDTTPLPVMLLGLLWGLRGGILAGVLSIPLNMLLVSMLGWSASIVIMPSEHMVVSGVAITGGIVAGYVKELDTMRKASEKSLKESEERYRIISSMASDYFYSMSIAPDGQMKVEWIGGAFEKITGYSLEEIRDMDDLMTMIVPEDLPVIKQKSKEILSNLKTVTQYRIKDKAGSEHWLLDTVYPVWDESRGRVASFIGTVKDITERNMALEALKASEEKFHSFYDMASDGIVLVDLSGEELTIVDANRSFCEMHGYEKDELIGKSVAAVLDKSGNKQSPDRAKSLLEGKALKFEVLHVRKDGSKFLIEVSLNPISIGGKPFSLGIERDISERKKAEDKLKLFTDAIEQTMDGVQMVDLEGRIIFSNRAVKRIYGYSPEELNGKYVNEMNVDQHIEAEVILPSIARDGYWNGELMVKRKDGKGFPIWLSATIVKDAHGNPIAMVGIIRDITEKKRAEEEERTKLITAIESSDNIIMMNDAGCEIRYVNEAFEKITGFKKGETIGKSLCQLFEGEANANEFPQSVCDAMKGGTAWSGRLRGKKEGGASYIADVDISPIKDADGNVTSCVSVMRDVSEKVALQSIAEAVNTMENIGYVFTGIRHEMGNPINSIKTTVSVLQSNIKSASRETLNEYAERIKSELTRMEYLLKSLKSFNMFENPEPENIQVEFFLDRLLSIVRDDFEGRGIKIIKSVEPGAGWAFIDPRAMQQVMLNLFTNASDALEETEKPEIEIAVRKGVKKRKDMITISVSDNGCGISYDEQGDLFKAFHTTKPGGTGLGLIITRKMLAKMNGMIEIKSVKGEGTVVVMTIPSGTEQA